MTGGGQVAEDTVAQGGPEELLRGALEKIVFFECRVSQLDAEVTAARVVAAREKEAAAAARSREVELETLLSHARSAAVTMKSRLTEIEERVQLLEAERERFLSGLVERARVAGAPRDHSGEAQGEQADLAGFIAELRDEIERLKPWKAAAEKAGISIDEATVPRSAGPVPPVSTLAEHFEKAGRLGVAASDTYRMKDRFATRAERSLYTTTMEDLASTDPGRR
jgi:chromosome segregation ATPase